jgi:hypothetical protein
MLSKKNKQKAISTQAKLYKECLLEAKEIAKQTLDKPTNEDVTAIAETLYLSVEPKFAGILDIIAWGLSFIGMILSHFN